MNSILLASLLCFVKSAAEPYCCLPTLNESMISCVRLYSSERYEKYGFELISFDG